MNDVLLALIVIIIDALFIYTIMKVGNVIVYKQPTIKPEDEND